MNRSVLVPPRISDVSNEIPGNIVRLAEYDLWMSSVGVDDFEFVPI